MKYLKNLLIMDATVFPRQTFEKNLELTGGHPSD